MSENLENKKVIENDEIDLIEVFRKIWDGRKIIFKWMGIFFVIGIIIVIGSPKEYKSEVTLLVETGTGNNRVSGLLQQFGMTGLNFGTAGEDALTPEIYPDIISSTPFLLEIMNERLLVSKDSTIKVSNYLSEHIKAKLINKIINYTVGLPQKIINHFSKSSDNSMYIVDSSYPMMLNDEQNMIIKMLLIRIKSIKSETSNKLKISVEMQDPLIAAQIADLVVKYLTEYIIDYRTQKAKIDLKFVEERKAEAEVHYLNAQNNLAYFKDKNRNVILESSRTTEQKLQSEFNLTFNLYNSLSQQLEQSKLKVQEKTPVFKIVEPAKIPLQKFQPKTSLIMSISIILGVCFGIGIVFFYSIFKFKDNI